MGQNRGREETPYSIKGTSTDHVHPISQKEIPVPKPRLADLEGQTALMDMYGGLPLRGGLRDGIHSVTGKGLNLRRRSVS